MSSDISVELLNKVNVNPVLSIIKPSYLVCLKSRSPRRYFITLDKPELLQGFIQTKGIYCELSEDEIVEKFINILTNTKKDQYLEVLIPWHEISVIRSLVFKAK